MDKSGVRLIDELGRVVLPVEIREAMSWGGKTPVEIRIGATGEEVVLKRHKPTCIYCGGEEDLKLFRKKPICPSCKKEICQL